MKAAELGWKRWFGATPEELLLPSLFRFPHFYQSVLDCNEDNSFLISLHLLSPPLFPLWDKISFSTGSREDRKQLV